MRKNERKVLKNNPGLADMLFELMFEKLWVAPHDPRRQDPALHDFERTARRLIVLLSDTDFTAAPPLRVRELIDTTEFLTACVYRLQDSKMFTAGISEEAVEAAREFEQEVRVRCGCAERQ